MTDKPLSAERERERNLVEAVLTRIGSIALKGVLENCPKCKWKLGYIFYASEIRAELQRLRQPTAFNLRDKVARAFYEDAEPILSATLGLADCDSARVIKYYELADAALRQPTSGMREPMLIAQGVEDCIGILESWCEEVIDNEKHASNGVREAYAEMCSLRNIAPASHHSDRVRKLISRLTDDQFVTVNVGELKQMLATPTSGMCDKYPGPWKCVPYDDSQWEVMGDKECHFCFVNSDEAGRAIGHFIASLANAAPTSVAGLREALTIFHFAIGGNPYEANCYEKSQLIIERLDGAEMTLAELLHLSHLAIERAALTAHDGAQPLLKKGRKMLADSSPQKDAYAHKYWQGYCDALGALTAHDGAQPDILVNGDGLAYQLAQPTEREHEWISDSPIGDCCSCGWECWNHVGEGIAACKEKWRKHVTEKTGDDPVLTPILKQKEIDVANHIRTSASDGCQCEPCIAARESLAAPTSRMRELLDAGIERGVGEHDMVRCRFCGAEGHNDIIGDYYGIKHEDKCVWLAAKRATPTSGAGLREPLDRVIDMAAAESKRAILVNAANTLQSLIPEDGLMDEYTQALARAAAVKVRAALTATGAAQPTEREQVIDARLDELEFVAQMADLEKEREDGWFKRRVDELRALKSKPSGEPGK